ncbi:MAG: outer membrane protein assembly factor BamD [Gammaproteobacteria bacterium]|jgi:outer membrane protein assembly factor BamD|nr:outer membrane protein assembly factor BamD [Gammaproteobacteria bacterium]
MRLFISLVLTLSLVGCGPANEIDPTADWDVERFYSEARAELARKNYLTAIEYYETLESRFPFGKYATQAQIDVAYAYFKFDEPDSAITALDRFIKLHPRHESVDYAYYLKGLVNFERGGTILDVLVERDVSAFDRNLMLNAYNDFKILLQRFPSSKYALDAKKRMIYLRNELARSDYQIANYYATREAWVAVANRTRFILQNYQGSSVIRPALTLQLQAYQKLGMEDLARDTQRIIDLNYKQGS